MTAADTAPFTWQYAVAALVFAASIPVVLLILRAIQVAVTRAIQRHVDRALTAPSNVVPLPSVAQRERSRT